jgi:hypothetical protein
MDDSTKEAIDSILAGKSRRYKESYARPRPASTPEMAKDFYEATRAAAEKLAKKPEPPRYPSSHCYSEEESLSNLKEQVATLSVDTSSASVVFKAPLNNTLISRINNSVPLTQREWVPDKKVWRFSPAAIPILKPILKDVYKDVVMLGVPKALPSTKFDQLISKLSKDDKAAVYKLLASRHHPDKGGSHEVMTLINIVFRG